MIADTTEELRRTGLDWKEDQMELMVWRFKGKIGDVLLEVDKRKYRNKEVEVLQAMGAMITKEADSMSAMRFRMMKADKAFWMDSKKCKNKGIAGGRTHKRYREVVQPKILHSCEFSSQNKEMVDHPSFFGKVLLSALSLLAGTAPSLPSWKLPFSFSFSLELVLLWGLGA